ncbi:GspH/FimT family pseudopilin [Pseudomonas sp. GOM7]|uniref:GspH/FimT family pseudopilin n=1 Tax=Pseudomonas sp. GOM7 TaxID=2998079 RepID=UPI00227CBE9B|nr:GspH/FimT family pseudopilin [Pseudomonas sp. GOM7]WAJ36646.1 GspH/FimT family pseudopilin [Pseudomonas sp. GOM7]
MKMHLQNALSLHELLVTISILGILISLVPPSYSYFIEHNRAHSIRNELVAFVNLTRMKAITERQAHMLCGSSDGQTCDGDWQHHWLVIRLRDDQLLKRFTLDHQYNLCWRGFGGENVTFRANGMTSASNGRFTFCNHDTQWQLVINRQGRLKIEDVAPDSGCCQTDHTDS